MSVKEINFVNGWNCGNGFDVHGYVNGNRGAALVIHIPTQTETFVDLCGCDYPEYTCGVLSQGIEIPSESEDGAEKMWRKLHAEFSTSDE